MNNYQTLPKIELHCHLDGSVRLSTALELALHKKLLPVDTCLEAIKEKLVVAEHCPDLLTYLQKFELPLQMMQDEETLRRIAYELLADAHAEHVKYL